MLFIDQRGFWLDEWYTLHAASLPMFGLVADRLGAGHSPLPFLYARGMHLLLGDSEAALRTSTAVMAGLAVVGLGPLLVRLRLKEYLRPVLLIAVFHPYWHTIGTEYRYMMPLVAAGIFCCWALARHLGGVHRRDGLLVALCGGLMMLVHPSAQFIWLALVVWLLWVEVPKARAGRTRPGAFLQHRLGPMLAAFAFSLPLLLAISQVKAGDGSSPGSASPTRALVKQSETLFGEDKPFEFFTGIEDDFLTLPSILVYLAGLALAFARLRRGGDALAGRFLASLLVVIPLAVMIYSVTASNQQGPVRYVAFTSLPALLVVAVAWVEAGSWRRWGMAWRGAFALLLAVNFAVQALNQGEWHREACMWLARHRQPSEPVITATRWINLQALRHHGLSDREGTVRGLNSDDGNYGVAYWAIRNGIEQPGTDASWILLYHWGRVPVAKVVRSLRDESFIVGTRLWRPTGKVVLLGLARNEAGRARLAAMEPFPMPWIAEAPVDVDDEEWLEFDDIQPAAPTGAR